MRLLFLLTERLGCVNTPTPVSVIFVRDRFGSLSTPIHVSVIPIKGEYWTCERSYSSVFCLRERNIWICEYSTLISIVCVR